LAWFQLGQLNYHDSLSNAQMHIVNTMALFGSSTNDHQENYNNHNLKVIFKNMLKGMQQIQTQKLV